MKDFWTLAILLILLIIAAALIFSHYDTVPTEYFPKPVTDAAADQPRI